jgi:ubiquinone/menaquinone biosynthesis C-methylase UbiE
MTDAREMYQRQPEVYDELVRCEDYKGNLIAAIRKRVSLAGAEVVELGAGTGRVTMLLAPHVQKIRAFDAAEPMLAVARRHCARAGFENCQFEVADNASLPVPDACADLAIAGWTYGHQTVWAEHAWREPIERALREMLRVLRPGGTAIVIETLGTGHLTPFEPPAALQRYYAMLEDEYAFARDWFRTDYVFPSRLEGERMVRAFFGHDLGDMFEKSGDRLLPECTGLWWRRV